MIKEKTLFILGAGASHTYGYPLGVGLRSYIIKSYADALNNLKRVVSDGDKEFGSDSQLFINKFKMSADTSIDIFLSKFPEFEFVGKMAIVYSILQAEKHSLFLESLNDHKRDRNEQNDDWMWHLYDILTRQYNSIKSISKINFDNISFVTFNYDRSLEHFLFTSLENGFNYKHIGGDPKELFDKISIEHVYGKVVDLPWEENNICLGYKSFNTGHSSITDWIDNIRVIYDRSTINLDSIHSKIREANRIYFLGFGYDITNLELLGIPDNLSANQKIFGTALGLYREEIAFVKSIFSKNVRLGGIVIENSNCIELLRKFYIINPYPI